MKKIITYLSACCWMIVSLQSPAQETVVDSLLNVVQTTSSDSIKVRTYQKLFLEYEFRDDAKASEFLGKAKVLAEKSGNKMGLAATYIYSGYFADDKGNYSEALKNYLKALEVYEEIGFRPGKADIYNNIGLVFYAQGNYPEALRNYFTALKIYEEIKDTIGIANSYNNIGNVYDDQENYELALKNQLESIRMRELVKHTEGMAGSYINLGILNRKKGSYEEALKFFNDALKIFETVNNREGIGTAYNNMGVVYLNSGKEDKALENYFRALKIREEIGDKEGICVSAGCIARVYIKLKDFSKAESYTVRTKNISLEIGNKEFLREAYKDLAFLDSANGDFKGAFENHKLFVLYSDSLDNEETRRKTIQSQMTYDFEKQEAVANAEHKKELENQGILSEEKSRKQKMILFLVSGFLVVVLFFAGFIFRSLKVTRQQKDIIEIQKAQVEWQKKEVEQQKTIVEDHQKEIIDSIYYARRIQQSLLPTDKYIQRTLARLKRS